MKILAKISLFLFLFCLISCSSALKAQESDAPKPPENYDPIGEKPLVSTINIPVNISRFELENAINKQLFDLIYEDANLDDDGLAMRAWKIAPITMTLTGNEIKYRVPVNIWVKKSLTLTSAEVDGDIALNFKTIFNIKEDWSLETWTNIETYEWLKAPKLKTSLWDIPVENLANLILNKSKSTLTASIDKLVREQMSLRPAVQTAWDAMQTPSLMSEDYQMWVKTTPISMTMTPLRCENEVIKTNIGVEAISEVTVGKEPSFRQNSMLPPFRFTNFTKDNFAVQIQTDIPFGEAAAIARKLMVGQTFASAGKTVRVDDIEIYGQGDKLVTLTKLSGGFNGKIYFIGKPVFDSTANVIRMQDFDYQLDTKNFLFKSASWIFQGQIKKMMEKNLTFPLEENIKTLRATIGQTLENFEIKPGIILTGNLDDVRFDRTFLTKNSIRVDMSARGKLNLDVKGL
jgi:Domain of unknown function (DUF4403)